MWVATNINISRIFNPTLLLLKVRTKLINYIYSFPMCTVNRNDSKLWTFLINTQDEVMVISVVYNKKKYFQLNP